MAQRCSLMELHRIATIYERHGRTDHPGYRSVVARIKEKEKEYKRCPRNK